MKARTSLLESEALKLLLLRRPPHLSDIILVYNEKQTISRQDCPHIWQMKYINWLTTIFHELSQNNLDLVIKTEANINIQVSMFQLWRYLSQYL